MLAVFLAEQERWRGLLKKKSRICERRLNQAISEPQIAPLMGVLKSNEHDILL